MALVPIMSEAKEKQLKIWGKNILKSYRCQTGVVYNGNANPGIDHERATFVCFSKHFICYHDFNK